MLNLLVWRWLVKNWRLKKKEGLCRILHMCVKNGGTLGFRSSTFILVEETDSASSNINVTFEAHGTTIPNYVSFDTSSELA